MDSSQRTAAATTDSELTTDTSALDLGNILLTTDTYAHILEYVLDSLPAKILRETCTGVCSTWNLAVQKILSRRRSLSWGINGFEHPDDQFEAMRKRFEEMWSTPSTVISFSNAPNFALQLPEESKDAEDPPSKRRKRRKKQPYIECLDEFLTINNTENTASVPANDLSLPTNDSALPVSPPLPANGCSCPETPTVSREREQTTDIYCINSRGIVGTDEAGLTHEVGPKNKSNPGCASFVSLPSFPDSNRVRIRRLRFTKADLDENLVWRERPERPSLMYGLPDDETDVKAVLIFAADNQWSAGELSEELKKKSGGKTVIAGGFVRGIDKVEREPVEDKSGDGGQRGNLDGGGGDCGQKDNGDSKVDALGIEDQSMMENGYDSSLDITGNSEIQGQEDDNDSSHTELLEDELLCLAFCGTGVRAASIIIPQEIEQRSDVERKLVQLRDTGISPSHPPINAASKKKGGSKSFNGVPSHSSSSAASFFSSSTTTTTSSSTSSSIGFMFSCVMKGENHFGEANVEANLFRKVFPGIPLTGFFGDGEIGIDVLPNFVVLDKDVAAEGGDKNSAAAAAAPSSASDAGVAWRDWFNEDLDEDDDENDEDFQSTLHTCSTIFVVLNFDASSS